MPEMTQQERHEQLVRLNETFIKQNKSLFAKNAKAFAKMRADLHKDVSGLNPVLQDQIEQLKDVSDDAQIANGKGQRELLKKTESTIAVLKTLAKSDSQDSEVVKELLRTAKDQARLLNKNISIVDAGLQSVQGVIGDTLGVAVGVLSESPILGMGIKAVTDFFGSVVQRRKDQKELNADAVLSALKKDRETLFEERTDEFTAAVDRLREEADDRLTLPDSFTEEMQDAFHEGLKEGMEAELREQGVELDIEQLNDYIAAAMEEMNLQMKEPVGQTAKENAIQVVTATGESSDEVAKAIDKNAAKDQDLMQQQADWLDRIRKDTRFQKYIGIAQTDTFKSLAKWLTFKATDKMEQKGWAPITKAIETAASLSDRIKIENEEHSRALYDKVNAALIDTLGVQTETIEAVPSALGGSFDDLGYLMIEGNDFVKEIRDMMSDDIAYRHRKDLGLEEQRREDLEAQRDLLEALKAGSNKAFDDEQLDDLEDSMFSAAGLGGLLAGVASALFRGLKFLTIAGVVGGMIYKIVIDALDYLKKNPGEYLDAALAGFAGLGNMFFDWAIKAVEFFGVDLSAIHKDKRDAWSSKIGLIIDNWFADLFAGIENFFVDLLPESVQKKLGMGKFKRDSEEGRSLLSKIDAVKVGDDLSAQFDMKKIANTMDAAQLQELIDNPNVTIDGQQIEFSDKIIAVLMDIRDKKIEFDEGKITKDQLDMFRDRQGVLQIEAPETALELISNAASSLADAVSTMFSIQPGPIGGTYEQLVPVSVPLIEDIDPELSKSRVSTREQLQEANTLNETRQRERSERLNQQNSGGGNLAINAPRSVSNNTTLVQTSSPYQPDPLVNRIDMNNLAP